MKKTITTIIFIILSQFIFCQNNSDSQIENDSIFDAKKLEIRPEFPEGNYEFLKLVAKKFQPPGKFSGKILVIFIVEKDGTLSNIEVENGNDKIEAEAIRVLKLSPNWKPGKYKDKIVRSKYRFPINIMPPE
jgi:hypothetical protein